MILVLSLPKAHASTASCSRWKLYSIVSSFQSKRDKDEDLSRTLLLASVMSVAIIKLFLPILAMPS